MRVSRRTFLKTLAAGTFAITTGIGLNDAVKALPAPGASMGVVSNGMWMIDRATMTIRYIGPPDGVVSVLDLHRWLAALLDEPPLDDQFSILNPNMMSRQTDTIFTLENDWRLSNDSYEHLAGGSVRTCDGDVYTNFITMGDISGAERIEVLQDGGRVVHSVTKPTGHIDALVKTRSKGRLIDSGKVCVRAIGPNSNEFVIDAGFGRYAVPLWCPDRPYGMPK